MKKGIGGHQSARSQKEEWLTPKNIIEALSIDFDFDLDPCAPIRRPWETAKNYYTIEDDGLSKLWHGRVWCNPPYGTKTEAWLEMMAIHNNGIALIFARTETNMFHRWVWQRATGLLFLRGRLHFHHVNGERAKGNAGAPSVLVSYGGRNDFSLIHSGLSGKYIGLRG